MATFSLRRPRSLSVLVILPFVGLLGLSACGSSADADPATTAAPAVANAAPLFKDLPANLQKAGTIQIGSSVDYPPFEFYGEDGKTLKGFEPELGGLLEKQLGVTFTWNNAAFDTLFSSLRSGRYDIIFGATNDTAEREQTFDFVYYLQSSQAIVVAKGNPQGIQTEDDLCGKTIAAVRGGIQPQWLEKKSGECTTSGKEKINVLTFSGNADEQLAVKQGRAAGLLENYPTAAVFAKESGGELELVKGLQVQKQYFGMVLPKESKELQTALQKAWQAIIDDGSYGKVLEQYGLSEIGIKQAGINAVASGAPTD